MDESFVFKLGNENSGGQWVPSPDFDVEIVENPSGDDVATILGAISDRAMQMLRTQDEIIQTQERELQFLRAELQRKAGEPVPMVTNDEELAAGLAVARHLLQGAFRQAKINIHCRCEKCSKVIAFFEGRAGRDLLEKHRGYEIALRETLDLFTGVVAGDTLLMSNVMDLGDRIARELGINDPPPPASPMPRLW